MELRRHIEILLLRNDCVIVPNLGGFMAHHLPSRFDESDQMFIPPLRTLGFNAKLTMSDSLLAQSYMDAYDLSYPEAVKRIEHEVCLLKEKMERDGSYELTDLGVLKVNANGRYEFEPCQSGILSPALYGLGAFEMPLLSINTPLRQAAGSRTAVTMPLHPVPNNHSTPSLATVMSHIDTPSTPNEEKTISIKVSVLRNLAVTAVAAVALILFARPVAPGEDAATTSEASMLSLPSQSQTSVSSTSNKAKAKASIIPNLCDLAKQIEESKNTVTTPTPGNYTIVLGCHLPLENAKYLMSKIQSNGVKDVVLFEYNSDNIVVYGNYKDREKAVEQLLEFSSNGLKGWVMEVKE